MSFTEYGNGDDEEFAFDLDDISSFLYSIGYLNKQKYNNIQKNKNSLKNYEIYFEENQNITFTDTSVKYGTLLTEINKLFNTNSSFEEHFQQYKAYTKSNINFGTYLNYLYLLTYIFKKFDDILNINSLLDIENHKISVIEIDSQDNSFNSKIEKIYNDLHDKNIYNEKEINPNLIILIFILSLNDRLAINTQENDINSLIKKFSLYNKVYISNIDLGLMLYLELSIFLQVYSHSKNPNKQDGNKIFNKIEKINIGKNDIQTRNKRKNEGMKTDNIFDILKRPFTSRNFEKGSHNNNKTEIGGEIIKTEYNINNTNYNRINYLNENSNEISILNDMSHIPNLYLFDNENIKFPNNPHTTVFLFQNYLKLISFYSLSQYNIGLLVNLTIKNLFVFREELNANKTDKNNINEIKDDKKEIENNENIKDYYSLKNYKNYDFYIFPNVEKKSLKNIRIDNISLFNNNVISIYFKNIYLNEFLIKLSCFDDEKLIEQTFNTYMDIIKKSNIFFIQELQFLSYSILDNLSISDLHLQYNIILYILEFFSNSKIIKKTRPKILSFKFNTFKININRDTKSIQLFFDFSKIKEKTIFNYIIQNQKMNILYNKYEIIINNLREIKNYETKIRLMQSNFRSHQVNFLFSLIIKKLVDYIDDIKTNRIHILESKFNTFNPNMKIYIKNEKTKRKTRLEEIRHMIQDFPLNQKVKMLYNNISQLEQNFDLIMLSDNYTKDFRLIRRCDENQIYFFITKEKKKINLLEKEKQIEDKKFGSTGNLPSVENKNNKQSQPGYNNFLNIIFYIKNDQNSFMNIINFLENLLEDEQCELQNNITMICDRFYLESYVIMEPSLKSTVKRLFAIVDNYYTIAKKSKSKKNEEDDDNNNDNEDFNYDIYIADEFIAVENYHQYNNKTNNNSELIYEFLTCISGCIEFIVYTLRAKDIYLEKFYYIVRNMNDKHFFFEYKNSNIFIKQIKDFDSLIFFNEKKANPLLCIFPKIPESEYTISVDNFYDLYLRLFLNLNKVEEQKEKLSQIFLYKVHKNIFYENYDSIILIAYSYDAFYFFNDFFLKNNFLSTTKEKFNNVHFIPFDVKGNNNSYMKILENQKNNTLIANNIYIYEYGFNSNFKFSKPNLFLLSYKKSEYLLDKTKELINNKNFVQDREEKKVLFKILRNKKIKKESIKPIINNIIMLWKKNDKINIYHLNSTDYENVLKNYQKNVYQIQTQKVDMRLQNLTEDAINNYNNLKNQQKNCIIY